MYINYGDRDFFENGILVDTEHSDTEINIIRCLPYEDYTGLYQFGVMTVDINDDWIDRNAVMSFIGATETTFNAIEFAIGCTDYYSWNNFGADSYAYDYTHMDKEEICKILKRYMIASNNLDIVW